MNKQTAPEMSYLLVSSDGDKVSVFAHSVDAALKANEWVTAALRDVPGGRGGGKANTAQGSAAVVGEEVQKAVRAVQAAAGAFTAK